MALASSVQLMQLKTQVMQVNHETREVRFVPIFAARAMKHGPKCKCEACSSLHMQRTKDKRMKAMMPGNVDMGNRQPAMSGKKIKADMAMPNNMPSMPNMPSMKAGGPGSGRKPSWTSAKNVDKLDRMHKNMTKAEYKWKNSASDPREPGLIRHTYVSFTPYDARPSAHIFERANGDHTSDLGA